MCMTGRRALTLDDLALLNAELAAIVRAGLPLDAGLSRAAADLPKRVQRQAEQLQAKLTAGGSLSDALLGLEPPVPAVYVALVAAGERTGRLDAALQSAAQSCTLLGRLRSDAIRALAYPVCILAVCLFLAAFLCDVPFPKSSAALTGLGTPTAQRMLSDLVAARAGLGVWAYALPAVPVALFLGWVWYSAYSGRWRSLSLTPRRSWWPSSGAVLADRQRAVFAQLCAALLENEVPLDQALPLAAAATGNAALRREADAWAAEHRLGKPSAGQAAGFSPLIRWLLQAGAALPVLLNALRRLAVQADVRAERTATLARIVWPTAALLAIAGTAVLMYASSVFAPYAVALYELAAP